MENLTVVILCPSQDGRSPLLIACMRGHEAIVLYLLDHRAEINVEDKVYSGLIKEAIFFSN